MEDDGSDSEASDSPVSSFSSVESEAGVNFMWTARVRLNTDGAATAYTRNHSFIVGRQASFAESDQAPSAIDYWLGALGGDLISGFTAIASRRGIILDAVEARVSGRLNNPLVMLGVVGETGHPGFQTISITLFVSLDADEPVLEEIWKETLVRSPLINTLKSAVDLDLELKSTI
jgi:hypothetical protein